MVSVFGRFTKAAIHVIGANGRKVRIAADLPGQSECLLRVIGDIQRRIYLCLFAGVLPNMRFFAPLILT
jgi:hypothetical protein